MSDELPPHPLGNVSVKVGRAFFAKNKNGGEVQSMMLLAQVHGTGKAEDGAKVTYGVGGRTISVQFTYKGDKPNGDEHYQQHYIIDIGDIVEALHALNKLRRLQNFDDAPPAEGRAVVLTR